MALTVEQMVQREVVCCMSSLVSALAQGYSGCHETKDLNSLCEQAYDLAAPIPDYEEAARENGFEKSDAGHIIRYPTDNEPETADSWQEACDLAMCDPYAREVYEHWAVSPWLADKLIQQGEKVDTDFANLNVWARTTTGQMIAADCVIERIHAALVKP